MSFLSLFWSIFRFAVTPLTQFYSGTLWFIVVLFYLLKVTATLFKTIRVSSLFFFKFVCFPSLFIACFFIYLLFFSLYFVLFYMYSVFPVTLSLFVLFFLLLCLFYYPVFPHSVFPVTLSLCYSVFPLILSLCHSVSSLSFCLFSCFCRTFSPPISPFILASFLPFHLFIFWYFCLNI